MTEATDLAQRLDRVESRFAMHDLVSDYCHGFDKHDWDRFSAIWWPDAVWDIGPPFGKFEGSEGIAHVTKDILWPAWLASRQELAVTTWFVFTSSMAS